MITKSVTFSGTVEAFPMLKSIKVEKEYAEVIDGATRHWEATGGVIVSVVFDVAGEEVSVGATVAAAQVANMTLAQVMTSGANLLKAKLGV